MRVYTFKSFFLLLRMKFEKERSKDRLMSRLPGYTIQIVQTFGHHQVSNRLNNKIIDIRKLTKVLLLFFLLCFLYCFCFLGGCCFCFYMFVFLSFLFFVFSFF